MLKNFSSSSELKSISLYLSGETCYIYPTGLTLLLKDGE